MSKRLEHTGPLFIKLGFLKLHDINKYMFCKFMYLWHQKKLPVVFDQSFITVRDVHGINTRQSALLYPPADGKTNLSHCKYTYRGPTIWNMVLKAKINPDVSEIVFSKSVKQCIKVGII